MGLLHSLLSRFLPPRPTRPRATAAAVPARDDGPALKAVSEALEPWRRAHSRPAWHPRVEVAPGAAAGSRFGGLPWLPDGTAHPRCGHCDSPLRLLVQLHLGSLPTEAQLGRGVLQAFYCERDACEAECDGWSPFSKAHLVRVVEEGPGAEAASVGAPFPARAIVGWERLEDLPSPQEHESEGLVFEHDFAAQTVRIRCPEVGLASEPLGMGAEELEESLGAAAKDKLLGWPHWVQGVEYPACPRCQRQMSLVFQLDSEDHLPHMWGDSGVAHVTRCPEHPEVLTLAWACC
jgi:hypothetical protein